MEQVTHQTINPLLLQAAHEVARRSRASVDDVLSNLVESWKYMGLRPVYTKTQQVAAAAIPSSNAVLEESLDDFVY